MVSAASGGFVDVTDTPEAEGGPSPEINRIDPANPRTGHFVR
jgi:hypothetical protein